jgi:dipeptide/tripeptide permease
VLTEELNVTAAEGIEFSMEDQGGIYTLIVSTDENGKLTKTVHQVVPPNSVSILWQFPQIFVISVAEILVSITGLEFVYSQVNNCFLISTVFQKYLIKSGPSMKAVANSFWGLTTSLGHVIIMYVNSIFLNLLNRNSLSSFQHHQSFTIRFSHESIYLCRSYGP